MRKAFLTLDPAFTVAPVNRRTFGTFVEHLGRCVYTGIYEPGHPHADSDGFRTDVLELTRELGVSVARYPGGNFVSAYKWEDGVGPVAKRPRRRELAWHSTETNEVGLDEFVRWAAKAGTEVMYAVNLGTRGVQEALDVHEYANHPGGTELSEQRIANGSKEPHNIRLWCLGNEMDGPWQIGHKTAEEYARLAAATALALKTAEPGLELVACGSSHSGMPTFGAWETTVLDQAYDAIDYISCHAYYEELNGDRGSFLAAAVNMDRFIDGVVATADSVAARRRTQKKIMISFDEWNVWFLSRWESREPEPNWPEAPRLLEDEYSVVDAVVVGNLLISLLRHSDRVTVACQAQLVNVIGPIRSEPGGPAWRQTIFHPFAATSRLARGNVLAGRAVVDSYATERYGDVPLVDTVATHDPETGDVVVFAVNRDQESTVTLEVDLKAFGAGVSVAEAWVLTDDDLAATNTADAPDRVVLTPLESVTVDGATVSVPLPRVSWAALRLRP